MKLFRIIVSITLIIALPTVSPFAAMASEPEMMTWQAHRRRVVHEEDSKSKEGPIIIGYAHNVESGKAEQAILDGARVIIWSFLHLEVSSNSEDDSSHQQKGYVRTDLQLNGISNLRNKYTQVVHLAAFGGWNGPHPSPKLNGEEWCEVFMEFNRENGYLFDGIDWDYEGHDDLNSPTAKFTLDTLDIMADFSICAKTKYGMIVSMAPAESYLDVMAEEGSIDASFSLRLDLPPRAWTSSKYASDYDRKLIESVGFSHAGRQCYAYVLAKAGIDMFDWISIQLYEAYSPFAHDLSQNVDPVGALQVRIDRFKRGFTVTEVDKSLVSEYKVKIPLNKLVIGVANKWADGLKFCKVLPESLKDSYQITVAKYNEGFLGVMFWVSYSINL